MTYLGGHGDSYTLNFSRPAAGVYVQLYQFLRLGKVGYSTMIQHQLKVSDMLRERLKKMTYKGKPRFVMMDATVQGCACLPVVAARLNPELNLQYDDIDLQHAIAEHQWYVSGYALSFNHPLTEERQPLFTDIPGDKTMFRVVVKANINDEMISHLAGAIEDSLSFLDKMNSMFISSAIVRNKSAHGNIPFAVSEEFFHRPKEEIESGKFGEILGDVAPEVAGMCFNAVAALKNKIKKDIVGLSSTC